jgi:sugar lactone lactonase YvrE
MLLVSDAAGCDTTISFTINAPVPVSATLVITPASCGGLCDGTATATPSGGTGPYDFLWGPGVINGQGTPVATDLKQPNGIIGTPDGKTVYVADIGAGKTYSYSVKADGTLENKTLFCETGSDGMTIDAEGNVYLTGKALEAAAIRKRTRNRGTSIRPLPHCRRGS